MSSLMSGLQGLEAEAEEAAGSGSDATVTGWLEPTVCHISELRQIRSGLVVQLGGPVCEGETKPNPAGCQGKPLSGFAYRDDEAAGSWKVDKIAPATEAGIPTDHVVMLDPTTKVLKQIVTGAEASVSEIAYGKRIEDIATLTEQMLATGKKIETLLNEKSNESGKFSFFM